MIDYSLSFNRPDYGPAGACWDCGRPAVSALEGRCDTCRRRVQAAEASRMDRLIDVRRMRAITGAVMRGDSEWLREWRESIDTVIRRRMSPRITTNDALRRRLGR